MKVVKAISLMSLLVAFFVASAAVIKVRFMEKEVELGEINKGQSYEHVFMFTNTSDKPLTISSVGSACGCTIISFTKTAVEPGEMGEIKIKYKPKKEEKGFIVKSFVVKFNDEELTEYLYLRGNIHDNAK